jgi:hypothetical protein
MLQLTTDDNAHDLHITTLADPMSSINCLLLHGGIPSYRRSLAASSNGMWHAFVQTHCKMHAITGEHEVWVPAATNLNHGIPPQVQQDNMIGSSQIETKRCCSQRHKQHIGACAALQSKELNFKSTSQTLLMSKAKVVWQRHKFFAKECTTGRTVNFMIACSRLGALMVPSSLLS